ncbi:MAG: flagellar biosynthesis protein FlhB [Gammaproteobacteria bacterium]|nr:flagellar biosynthesis protein FlhB [Gammaproteobacteria bacterium]
MAESESGQEKTEEPTPKKLQKAKDKGQVARSRELTTLMMLLASAGGIIIFGSSMIQDLMTILKEGLIIERKIIFSDQASLTLFLEAISNGLLMLAPLFVVLFVVALFSPVLLGGIAFVAPSFKIEKINPVKGIKRIFGPQGGMELLKALAKFFLVFAVAIIFIWSMQGVIFNLGYQSVIDSLVHTGDLLLLTFLLVSASLLVVAGIDVPFQMWNHQRQLKMTLQEVKDEFKETEGKPEVKQHIRKVQQEMAQRRMMDGVPQADVIITNPTHYAVALRYDKDKGGAPVLLAKGADLVAMRIRAVGVKHKIIIMESPMLARSIFHHTELNAEIPDGLYRAVAQVLAYVYQLKKNQRSYSAEPQSMKDNLPIPDDLKR